MNFAIIGASGYIAPRHMKAIKETNNQLITAYDINDSVGIIDSYFPKADFFKEFERFDRHIEKLNKSDKKIDYVSICSPNYLHDSHIRSSLKWGANVICEKPIVLNPWNLDSLIELEKKHNKKIYTILQLRYHKSIIKLKKKIDKNQDKIYDVDLTYITSRGNWYYTSWKSNESKSGGIMTNIGVHFFDILLWIFGDVIDYKLHLYSHDRSSGILVTKNARIRWFLSINSSTIPKEISNNNTYRSIKINNKELEFSNYFTELHTLSYQEIFDGNGFGLLDSYPSVEIVHKLRKSKISPLKNDYHPLSKLKQTSHPFTNK